jgi:Tripartite tricarboxylate transporter family receptor
VSNSKRRNIKAETLPMLESRRTQRRLFGATLHGHPLRVKAIELPRRHFLRLAAGATALRPRIASAQATYPTRPITMIVPLAAGSPADGIGRLLADQMKGSLGQPIIVENVAGAEGRIAVDRAARARPDGYMIELGGIGNHVLNGLLYPTRKEVLNDFAPISLLGTTRYILYAKKSMPARDPNELIAWLRANPNAASAGFSIVPTRLLFVTLQRETGTRFVLVPYRGPVIQDLVSGQIDLFSARPIICRWCRPGVLKLMRWQVTHAWRPHLTSRHLAKWGYRRFPFLNGRHFSHRRAHERILSTGLMQQLSRRWPILRCNRAFPISAMRSFPASNKRRRHSVPCKKLTPRNGGRSSWSQGSGRSKPLR